MANLSIYTDGGARGNPGPAALGVYIKDDKNNVLAKIGKKIGIATNNVAEYAAIAEGLSWAIENKTKIKIESVNFYMDSQLAYSQLVGIYKVKNDKIRKFIFEIRQKEMALGVPVFYNHIPREMNKDADAMVNQALDNKLLSD